MEVPLPAVHIPAAVPHPEAPIQAAALLAVPIPVAAPLQEVPTQAVVLLTVPTLAEALPAVPVAVPPHTAAARMVEEEDK